MRLAYGQERVVAHRNAFGFLRLLFASLVIVSHVPEIVDNNNDREILSLLTGTTTFGVLAVNGFFVISGYLIAGSLLSSSSIRSYLAKRAVRLYPGFIVASIVCLAIVAPLSGASYPHGLLRTIAAATAHMAALARPSVYHPFPGQNFSGDDTGLNGAMWTIQYEFACYLLLAVLHRLRMLRGPLVVVLALAMLAIGTWLPDDALSSWSHRLIFPGKPASLFLLSGMFLSGAAWYLYREKIVFRWNVIALAAVLLSLALLIRQLANVGFAFLGTYLILAVATRGNGTVIERINNRSDVSYGVYLYAWPAEQLLIRYGGTESLLLLGIGTWLVAIACGWLSWNLIERPALDLLRARSASDGLRQPSGEGSPPRMPRDRHSLPQFPRIDRPGCQPIGNRAFPGDGSAAVR